MGRLRQPAHVDLRARSVSFGTPHPPTDAGRPQPAPRHGIPPLWMTLVGAGPRCYVAATPNPRVGVPEPGTQARRPAVGGASPTPFGSLASNPCCAIHKCGGWL